MARARRHSSQEIDDLPMLLDARRRRAARRGSRPLAHLYPAGSMEELRHYLEFACEELAAGCELALPFCRRLDAEIRAREATVSDKERFLRIAGGRA